MSSKTLSKYDKDVLTIKLRKLDSFFLSWIEKASPDQLTESAGLEIIKKIYAFDGRQSQPPHFTKIELIHAFPSTLLKLITPIVEAVIRWTVNGSTEYGLTLLKYVTQLSDRYLTNQTICLDEFRGIEYLINRVDTLFKCQNNGDSKEVPTEQDKIQVYLYGFDTLERGGRFVVLLAKWWTHRLFDDLMDEAHGCLGSIIQLEPDNWLWHYYHALSSREIRQAKNIWNPNYEEIHSILNASKLAVRTEKKHYIQKSLALFCRLLGDILRDRRYIATDNPLDLGEYKFTSYGQIVHYIKRRADELLDRKEMYEQHLIYANIFSSDTLPLANRNPELAVDILQRYLQKNDCVPMEEIIKNLEKKHSKGGNGCGRRRENRLKGSAPSSIHVWTSSSGGTGSGKKQPTKKSTKWDDYHTRPYPKHSPGQNKDKNGGGGNGDGSWRDR